MHVSNFFLLKSFYYRSFGNHSCTDVLPNKEKQTDCWQIKRNVSSKLLKVIQIITSKLQCWNEKEKLRSSNILKWKITNTQTLITNINLSVRSWKKVRREKRFPLFQTIDFRSHVNFSLPTAFSSFSYFSLCNYCFPLSFNNISLHKTQIPCFIFHVLRINIFNLVSVYLSLSCDRSLSWM